MSLYVLKFGGTSLETTDCIERVADSVEKHYREGNQLVVVLSAMGHETNRLIALANAINPEHTDREYAMLVSTGEQVSVSLLAMALAKRNIQAKSLTGWQAGIATRQPHRKSRVEDVNTTHLSALLKENIIPIVTGFQGVNASGDITTLGRGGSDTTALALAHALKADECHIFTDVEGVFSCDPRLSQDARCIAQIDFEEMIEMASQGSEVLHHHAVELAGKCHVPLRVLSTFKEGEGTLIHYQKNNLHGPAVTSVACNKAEAKFTVFGLKNDTAIDFQILQAVAEQSIEVDMITKNIDEDGVTDFTFTVHRDDYDKTLQVLKNISGTIQAKKIMGDANIVKLSIIGLGMRAHAGVAATMFEALAKEGINVQAITTSEIKVSVLVDEIHLEEGVRVLHQAFGLHKA